MASRRRLKRLWYFKRRNLRYYRFLLCITFIILVFLLMLFYVFYKLYPIGLAEYQEKVEWEIRSDVEKVIDYNEFSDQTYKDLVEVKKDQYGSIVTSKVDNIALKKLGSLIESRLKELLLPNDSDHRFTAVKAGILPYTDYKLNLGGAKIDEIKTSFTSRFYKDGSNGTRLKIALNVNVEYEYLLGKNYITYEFTIGDAVID